MLQKNELKVSCMAENYLVSKKTRNDRTCRTLCNYSLPVCLIGVVVLFSPGVFKV